MVEDVNAGIAWVTRRVARYGGDPEAVHLVGQSAGGQLALLALLNQVRTPRAPARAGPRLCLRARAGAP